MAYDYSDAPPARDLELIPHGTTATLVLHPRPGGVGEDGMLKRTRAGDAEMLDCELVVADGPHYGGPGASRRNRAQHAQGDP